MLLIQHGMLHTMETDDPIQADLLIRDGEILWKSLPPYA